MPYNCSKACLFKNCLAIIFRVWLRPSKNHYHRIVEWVVLEGTFKIRKISKTIRPLLSLEADIS